MRPGLAAILFGAQRPAVLLDFTTGRYQVGASSGSSFTDLPGASFTRASTGTALDSQGNVISFSSGVPRITDLGLLVEESRTNLLLQSQAFDNASWGKTDTTITADQIAAPDGTVTADLATEGSAGSAQINQGVTISAGQSLVATRYFKRGNTDWVLIKVDSNSGANGFGKWFNLNTGALGSNYSFGTGGYTSASIASGPNGWYRCTVVGTVAAAATAAAVRTFNTSGDNTETRVNGATRYEWGAGLEAGATFPTSYIPTTSATVTRAADVASVTGLTAPSADFTLFAQAYLPVITDNYQGFVALDDGTAANQNYIFKTISTNRGRGAIDIASSTVYDTATLGATTLPIFAVGINKLSLIRTGGNVVTEANRTAFPATAQASMPPVSRLSLGKFNGSSFPTNGYLQRISLLLAATPGLTP